MGEETVAMKSKTVTIEADGVCGVKGKMALKLQEADGPKGKKQASAGQTSPAPEDKAKKATVAEKEKVKTLKVQLHDGAYRVCAKTSYRLKLPTGKQIEDKTDAAGWLVHEVPAETATCTVSYRPGPDADVCTIDLDLREIAKDSEEHYRLALKHLGFPGIAESGGSEFLHLQAWADLGMTDRFDDQTKAFIKDLLAESDDAVNKGFDEDA
jgi:hypothetical protein